eukprot:3300504-Amphidinium_carterae.1
MVVRIWGCDARAPKRQRPPITASNCRTPPAKAANDEVLPEHDLRLELHFFQSLLRRKSRSLFHL